MSANWREYCTSVTGNIFNKFLCKFSLKFFSCNIRVLFGVLRALVNDFLMTYDCSNFQDIQIFFTEFHSVKWHGTFAIDAYQKLSRWGILCGNCFEKFHKFYMKASENEFFLWLSCRPRPEALLETTSTAGVFLCVLRNSEGIYSFENLWTTASVTSIICSIMCAIYVVLIAVGECITSINRYFTSLKDSQK